MIDKVMGLDRVAIVVHDDFHVSSQLALCPDYIYIEHSLFDDFG